MLSRQSRVCLRCRVGIRRARRVNRLLPRGPDDCVQGQGRAGWRGSTRRPPDHGPQKRDRGRVRILEGGCMRLLTLAAVFVVLAASATYAQSDFSSLKAAPGDVVYVIDANGVEI